MRKIVALIIAIACTSVLMAGPSIPAVPAGAAALGFTKLVINERPAAADIAPGPQGDFKWFSGHWWQSEKPPQSRYSTRDGVLAISLDGCLVSTPTDFSTGKLPLLPGADGFYVEFDYWLSDSDPDHWPAVWLMPAEHNGAQLDHYPGDPAGYERWMELDIDEGGLGPGLTGTVHSWYGIYADGYQQVQNPNNASSLVLDRRRKHTFGGSYDPVRQMVTWWVDGVQQMSAGAPYVPAIAARQHFYLIISAQTLGKKKEYTMFVSGVRAYVPPSSKLPVWQPEAPTPPTTPSAGERPNILLILADDLGWSDLGCYGGEIRTPNLDSLARGGLRFTQFYNSARCSPTRAAILTGLHPHQAGFPNLSGVLPAHCVTIPEALRPAGYRCYMVGKWHLSRQSTPTQRGFHEFYGMLGGFNSCWKEEPFYTRLPEDRMKRMYAPGAFYSTDVFGDYALDFIEEGRKSGQPWLFYLAFNAPHFPLHARDEDIAKYEKLYAQGWDKIREQRLARQKELGLMPADLTLTPRSNIPANRFNAQTGWADKDNPAWDALPAGRRADLARRMAVYAAMVDRMDQVIGRVVARLKETGQFDNTLIFFLSDNGACAEWDPWGFDETSGPKNVLHAGADLQKVGGPDSYVSYGSAWANACNTPFRLYKHYGHEGGINTPLIVHWPAGLKTKAGAATREAGHITDLMPTVLDVAGASYPQDREGRRVLPLEGVSLAPVLRGGSLPPRQIFMEHEGNRAVREGRWKLVALKDKLWELYDLETDPTEMKDLAAGKEDLVARLAQAWEDWADRCLVRQGPDGYKTPKGRKK